MLRERDWSSTPLGTPDQWPHSLKTAVRIMLTSRQPMYVFWGSELIKLYNDAYQSVAGKRHPHAFGQPAAKVWHEIWHQIQPRVHAAVYENEGTYSEAELLIMERNGYREETYYTFSFSPIPNDDGGPGGMLCVNTDDTHRIIGERQIRLLRELAARTAPARSVAEAVQLSAEAMESNRRDLPFSLIYLQAGEQPWLTLAATAGVPADLQVRSTLRLDQEQNAHFRELLAAGKPHILSSLPLISGPLPTGEWPEAPAQVVALPIAPSGQGGHSGLLIAGLNPFRLLDESYQSFLELVAGQISSAIGNANAYQQERERAEALAEIDRAKTAFFSNASHEFRTPLTLLLGPLHELLTQTSGLPEGSQELLEIAHRNGIRLLKLVNSLLDFARIEAGRVQAQYQWTDLAQFTAELASTFRSATDRAGLSLVTNCFPLDQAVFVDRDMWEKVILNLLSNAFKFTFEGGITVSTRTAEDGSGAFISVRDTGIGISEEELPRLFERFHRVEGARGRTHEGTGIGLALVQELVRLHGGTIQVISQPGVGTEFVIRLPFGSSHLPADRVVTAQSSVSSVTRSAEFVEEALRWLPGGDEASPLQLTSATPDPSDSPAGPSVTFIASGRILLADDNADMRDYVRRLLEQQGYQVTAVPNGRMALQVIQETPPDLVLTDVMMPEMDGFQLLTSLRQNADTRMLPVILLSARAGEESRVEGLRAGADDYMVKPFSARELLARIVSHLVIGKLRRDAAEHERVLRAAAVAERERFRDLLMRAPAIIAVSRGPDHIFELVNPEYVRFVGANDESELLNKPVREVLPAAQEQGFVSLMDQVYESGIPYIGRASLFQFDRYKTGRPEDFYLNFVYQPFRGVDGRVEGVLLHAVDVTDLVLARQRVEASEQNLKMLAESIPQLVWTCRADGSCDYLSGQWVAYTGIPAEQQLGLNWLDAVVHPDDRERTRKAWMDAVADLAPYDLEYRIRRHDGRYRWFKARGTPLRSRDGEITQWFGTCTDIEDQKQSMAERQILLEREQEARSIAEILNRVGPALLAELDLDRVVQRVTDLATELVGAEAGAFLRTGRSANSAFQVPGLSRQPGIFWTNAGWPPDRALLRQTLAQQTPLLSADIRMDTRPALQPFAANAPFRSYLAVPVVSRTGELWGGLFFAHALPNVFSETDVDLVSGIAAQAAIALENARLFAQTQQAQEALQMANEDLRQANADLEQFAYAAAHDLKEPLRMVTSYTQLLSRRLGDRLTGQEQGYADYVINGAQRVAQLLEDLLVYTETSRDFDGPLELVNLDAVVKQTLMNLEPMIQSARAEIIVDPMPSVLGRGTHFQQLFQNLISNAIIYRKPGVAPRIRLACQRSNGDWEFAVEDNGIGIAPSYHRHIFGIFKRLHGKDISGTGMGLAICARVVERCGGRIWVNSELGRGATFRFTLPVPDLSTQTQ